MIKLFERDQKEDGRKSSKGNQLKWFSGNRWYKADYTGYEGFSEYVVSELLRTSSLHEQEYVLYQTEEILYKEQHYSGCCSENMLPDGWQIITLERLFHNRYGESLYRAVFLIEGIKERMTFVVQQVERLTGLEGFGPYLAKLMTVDALFLNEDRHMHNIALLQDSVGKYHLCPMFDHGAALLSDTHIDYPMTGDIYHLAQQVKAKTFSDSFDEQLDAAEELYGQQICFHFTHQKVEEVIGKDIIYPAEVHQRVQSLVFEGMRKYPYLFA